MKRTTRPLLIIVIAITCSLRSAIALPNPVGWWKFDEGSGTLTADSSGNGSTGTVAGSWITDGMASNAVTYTTSQFTTIPYKSGFDLSNSITLSIWIKPSGPGQGGPAFSQFFTKGNGYFGDWSLLYCDGFNIQFQMTGMNGNSIASASRMPSNLWTHVVATFDGTTAKLYINGLLDRFAAWPGSRIFTTNGIQIGSLPGAIDDARIYSNALTEIQVAQLFLERDKDLDRLIDANETICGTDPTNPDSDGDGYSDGMEVAAGTDPLNSSIHPDVTTGLVGWWKLDEGSGTLTADSTTNGNTGTLSGSPAWATGIHSNALQFDGVDDFVVSGAGGSSSPLAVTNLTIAFWAYVTNTTQDATVIDRRSSSGGYSVDWQSTYNRLILISPSIQPIPISLDDVAPNVWNHFAFTYDGSTVRCYLNGRLYTSDTYTNAIGSSDYWLNLAQATWYGNRFQGILDDVRIYNRALAAGDVYALALVGTYNNGLPDIQKSRLGLNPNAASTTGNGIPDDWAVKYGLNPLDATVAAQTSPLPFTHGLSNLQVYQNQSVLIADNYSTLGDGIADWWKVTYGFGLTDTNVASGDPEGDGLSNLQKYQAGLSPFVSYAVTAPTIVLANSSGNTASVTDAGAGASYAWTIDNGTIDSGAGTTNVSWSAGDGGMATLAVQLTTSSGTINLSAPVTISPCQLPSTITVPRLVFSALTNTASVPTGFFTLNSGFTNGAPYGVEQSTSSDSNFYGLADIVIGEMFFKMTPAGTLTMAYQFDTSHITNGYGSYLPLQGTGNDTNHFYGVTYFGGKTNNLSLCLGLSPWFGYGSIFKLTQQGASMTLTTLYKFTSSPDGANPIGGLVLGAGGDSNNFYGVTEQGGSTACSIEWGCCLPGNGTVFKFSSIAGTNATLYRFLGGSDGEDPRVGIILGRNGYLYGVTSAGSGNYGTVFRINTNGTSFLSLHQFTNSSGDGATPLGSLVEGSGTDSNNFYGTAYGGGTNGYGTVFKVNSNGTSFVTLHQFNSASDGAYPAAALVQSYDGNYYGTTTEGGPNGNGTVFRMTPQGTLTTLYSFTGGADGGRPDYGEQVSGKGTTLGSFDGYLYGATTTGGSFGHGTVYKVSLATYGWSITDGTITSGLGTPNIIWTAGSEGAATICVTVSNSLVCSTNVCTNVYVTVTSDTVGDGIPDFWRAEYFGGDGATTNNQSCATCDFYGIGINNLTAYLEGRDPTKQAVPDTNAVVNLVVYTPLE